ncbi:hypothetical protein IWW55_004417, partial [Coemansia sp. RSA 2706]
KEIKRTKEYTRSKRGAQKRRKQAEQEAEEAEQLRRELGLDDQLRKAKKNKRKQHADEEEGEHGEIAALMRQRTAGRMNAIIANIEEKYASQPAKKKGKKAKAKQPAFVEPSEEEFQALQAKLFTKK